MFGGESFFGSSGVGIEGADCGEGGEMDAPLPASLLPPHPVVKKKRTIQSKLEINMLRFMVGLSFNND
jgi:hypothetical protein